MSKKKQPHSSIVIARGLQLGLSTFAAIIFFLFLGISLDSNFDTKPLFTICGILVGILTSIIIIYFTIEPLIKDFEEDDKHKL